MLELRFTRENLELVKEKTKLRGIKDSRIEDFETVDIERRALLAELEGLRNKRKTVSSEIAELKKPLCIRTVNRWERSRRVKKVR